MRDSPCENLLCGLGAESRQPRTGREDERIWAGPRHTQVSWAWAGEGNSGLGGQQGHVGDPGRRRSQAPEQAAFVARGADGEKAQPRQVREPS